MARARPGSSAAKSERAVRVAMVAVVLAFLVCTLVSQSVLTSDVEALDIASNAAPSVAYLADARADLRQIERAARDVDAGRPGAHEQLLARRRALDESLRRYAATPEYPGEHELFQHVEERLQRLDELIKPDGEQALLTPRIDELEHALRDLSELNRAHLSSSQQGVLGRERRFAYYSLALDGVALLLTLAAAWLVARTVRGYALRLERRTAELEHLAVQVGHEIGNPLTPLTLALEGSPGLEAGALGRGQKAIARIRGSVDRLIAFAEAGRPPARPAGATEVGEALRGLDVKLHGDTHARVAWEPAVLRGVVADLLQVASEPPQQLLSLEVRVRPFHVRLAAVCAVGDGGVRSSDPFEPQLHEIESGHPGIDLRLATVRRRVEARGGAVGVRDARGERVLWLDLARG